MGGKSGGIVGTALDVVGDVAAVATGNPEFIPLINAGISAGTGLAEGESVGKALTQGAISGGEALAGQEVAGALGIGQGNTAFNSALGITGDNPAGTGLPDIGSFFSSGTTGAPGAPGATPPTTTASGSPVAPAAGGAPASSVSSSGSFTPAADIGPEAQAAISAQTSPTGLSTATGVAGPATTGSPNLGSINTGNPQIDSLVSGFQAGQPVNDSLPPSVISASNAASPGGTDVDLNQQGTLANLTGSTTPVAQGSAPVSTTGTGTAGGGSSGAFGGYGKYAAAAIPVGELAYEAIKGPGALPSGAQALEQGGAATAPLLATEKTGLNAYNSGTLTAPQQAQLTQYIQQQQNQLISQLAQEGVTNFASDSRYISGMQTIQQNALAQMQNFLSASLNAGLSAAGNASSNLSNVANEQLSQDQQFQSSLTGALTSLGSIVGGGSGINISVAK